MAGAQGVDLSSLLFEESQKARSQQSYVSMPQGIGRIDSDKKQAAPEEEQKTETIEKPTSFTDVVPGKKSANEAAEVQALIDELANETIEEKPVVTEKPVEVEKIVEKQVIVEKPVEVEKLVEVKVPVTNTVEKIVIVEKTNVVEKIVVDKVREQELLAREQELLNRQKELLSEKDNLGEQLSKERDRRQRLERVIPKENRQFADNFLRITAPSTFYDRKEGYAVFQGGVYVHDNDYELHSRRAFVFNDPVSNTVSRIVALENVAVTNGPQRAYGVKASYYRSTGMVILYGDENTPAIVRDESRVEDQEVVGSKIKFWLNSQQVEVLKARIKAPVDAGGGLKRGLMGR